MLVAYPQVRLTYTLVTPTGRYDVAMSEPLRDRDERVSLDGLTPEEALRALLAVKPDADNADHDDRDEDESTE